MPVFESESFLEQSLNSLLKQSLDDFEIICICDPSEDSSLEILKRYEKENNQISVIVNDQPKGLPASLNIGLEKSNGKYIARNDADDISEPRRLEKQFRYLEDNPEIFLCGTNAKKIDENGEFIRETDYPEEINQNLLNQNPVITSSVMWRSSEGYRYREKFSCTEDLDMRLRLLSDGKKMQNLNTSLVKYRIHPESISNKKLEMNYFAGIAEKFYRERARTGKDSYKDWKPKTPEKTAKKGYESRLIPEYLKSEQYKEAQLEAKKLKTYSKCLYLPFCKFPLLYRTYRRLNLQLIKQKVVRTIITKDM